MTSPRRFGRDGGEVPAPPLPPAWTPGRPGGAALPTRLPSADADDVAEEVWWAVAEASEPTTLTAETADLVERCVRAALAADRAHRAKE